MSLSLYRINRCLFLATWLVLSQSTLAQSSDSTPGSHPRSIHLQAQFFTFIDQKIAQANHRIQTQRQYILAQQAAWRHTGALPLDARNRLRKLTKDYALSSLHFNRTQDWQTLLARVDIIPASLTMAQAAVESAYGRSRFAKQANNYFGQWCFTQGCGLVPKKRPKGRHYEVQRFASPADSVWAYCMNLNAGHHYQDFRTLRAKLRAHHQPLTGLALSATLNGYSQRGQAYVELIQQIIRTHRLQDYDRGRNPKAS